jgi:hypothetical protein
MGINVNNMITEMTAGNKPKKNKNNVDKLTM